MATKQLEEFSRLRGELESSLRERHKLPDLMEIKSEAGGVLLSREQIERLNAVNEGIYELKLISAALGEEDLRDKALHFSNLRDTLGKSKTTTD